MNIISVVCYTQLQRCIALCQSHK